MLLFLLEYSSIFLLFIISNIDNLQNVLIHLYINTVYLICKGN
ncbi:hypothetical protein BACUNI_02724 [Bacteroides uniformis ATCC 8492]|uniref:CPBP family intramembrane metalloprotease n=1 Tax=Bacteroides uniformis (strain ATCC 8492 / DSM 6597 / CCUG 4942 / CIP 103695 / JCM 5828 / KCTC 5204 / NCTC 13054 / VPI 0061) TaxID=411479 RepID=A0ABC9N9X4_BACUC|nr:hypothetical protein BACUNI_02724 [Bacteroides uniformis ATCC 8492]